MAQTPQALTPAQRRNLRSRFIQGVKNAFSGDPGNTISGQPVEDFLAGPAPANPFSRFQWDSGRRVCRRWADGRTPAILPGRDIYYKQLCEPYIEDEFGPIDPGTAAPPFEGGQCAEFYRLFGNVEYNTYIASLDQTFDSVRDVTTEYSLLGPILGFSFRYSDPGPFGNRRWILDVTTGGGVVEGVANFLFPDSGGAVSNARFAGTVEIQPGLTDDCGDPPDLWQPGDQVDIPPETGPVPSPPGWEIPDFDIDIDVDIDGNINIDFGDGEPPEVISPDPPSDGPALEPGDQGEGGDGGVAGGGDDAEGEAPPGQVLVGLRMQLVSAPENASQYAPGVYRGAAYIYMGGDVSLDHDFAGSMLREDQFVYAEKDNLTRWRVASNPGYVWNVTPYYRTPE